MNKIAPRKQLGIIDYKNVPINYVYLGRLPSPFSNPQKNYENIADFYVGDGYLINRREDRKNGISDDMPEQFEMPLAGVSWMINAIEQGFEKPPSEGGLEKNKLHTDTTLNEERLRIMYGVCVGGEGVGGYTIKNTSRSSYILPRYSQQFSITVDIWQQVGRKFFKDILKRINSGEFN
ncbi:hypothetical protein [Cellvibrio sp. OA-2007]|uniref:hypothetical protein n=1 Tax=Cellvibrio sp. OA-2007 TaxID=529823 RepID=UPI000786351A|nr:hypothetical protein [Cellvibrio sp. OA-2007]